MEDLGSLIAKLGADASEIKNEIRGATRELTGFRDFTRNIGSQVKRALTFAGVAVGLYEIGSALRSFATDAARVGARTETLQVSLEAVGKNAGVSAESLKYYTEEVKSAGITTQESMTAIINFLTSGLPLTGLKDFATRARDVAVVAGKNTSETLNAMVHGIVSGQMEVLRNLHIPVRNAEDVWKEYAATLGKTKDELTQVEKQTANLNEVMRATTGYAGLAAKADETVGKQLASMARFAEEAKNSLWALFGPVMQAAVEQMTGGWKSLQAWAEANRETLEAWGENIGEFIEHKTILIRKIIQFASQSKETIKILFEFIIVKHIAGWLVTLGTAAVNAGAGLKALAVGATAVQIAMGGWLLILTKLLVALAAYGAYQTVKRPAALDEMSPEEAQLLGEAGVLKLPRQVVKMPVSPEVEGLPPRSPAELKAKAEREAQAARDKAARDAAARAGAKGKGGKGTAEDPFGEYLQLLEQQRQAEIQAAQDSLDLLKATNEAKRAELEKSLAEGLLSGQDYYRRLQDLQQAETAASLALIAQKRQAQQQAYQDALADINRTELSPEAAETRRRLEAAKNRMALAQFDAEAARVRLDGEKKVTEELTRQVKLKKETQREIEDLNLETAQLLGAISEQEAKLQRLTLDWLRVRQAAIDAGRLSPELDAALAANLEAKKLEFSYGGQKFQAAGQIVTAGVGEFVDTLWQGGAQISLALDTLGQKIVRDTFKLFFDDLAKAISQGIKGLGNAIARELQGASAGGGGWLGAFFSGVGNWFRGWFGGGGATFPVSPDIVSAHGMAFAHGYPVHALARGGVVARPTLFPMADGLGLMGEAGPEGVLPLERIRGNLGVRAILPGGPTQVKIVNNLGVEAQATATQNDQGDLEVVLDKAMTRIVGRGGSFTQALLATFNIGKRF